MSSSNSSVGILKVGLACLKSARASAVSTYRSMYNLDKEKHTAPESTTPVVEVARVLEPVVEEEPSAEDFEEGMDAFTVDYQLGDIIDKGGAYLGDENRLQANEMLLSSKIYALITVSKEGSVHYQINTEGGSSVDLAGCQIMCSQVADSLYEQFFNTHPLGGADEDGADDVNFKN